MASSLSINQLGKKVGNSNLLANLSFGAEKGEILFILGKSNSGKSTLFKILMGLSDKDKGKIFINGMNYDQRQKDILSIIGYMPKEDIFDSNLNVFENLFLYARLQGLSTDEAKNNILKWSEKLDFKNHINSNIGNLSSSIIKKISFARALVNEPEFLLLDNPTVGMDAHDTNIFFSIINRIKIDKTILFASDNFDEAENYSDRIIIIHNGEVSVNGSMKSILDSMKAIYKYRISFKRLVPNDFFRKIKENKSVIKSVSRERHIEIAVQNESVFFSIMKLAFEYDVESIKTQSSKLNDIFLKVTE